MNLTSENWPQDPRFMLLMIDGCLWKRIYKYLFIRQLKILQRSIDKTDLEEKWEIIEKKGAEEAALKLLARKSYFSSELRKKLEQRNLSVLAIEHALEKCVKFGYIDDARESERFIQKEERMGRGPRLIKMKLKSKGIKAEVQINQKEAMQKLLSTRLRKYSLKDPKQRQKAALALQRRGFDLELISALIYKESF